MLIEDRQIVSRRGEVSTVENVEQFRPELRVEIFRDAPNAIVLEYRNVQLGHAGTNQGVATQISPFVRTGEGQTLRLDVVVGISRVTKYAAARPCQAVRELTGLIHFHAGRITTQDWSKRLAGACFVEAAQLPTTGRPSQASRTPGGTGEFPGKAQDESLCHVEVGDPARSVLIKEKLIEQTIGKGVVPCGCR